MKSDRRILGAVVVLVAAVTSLTGIRWGLANPPRIDALFSGDREAVVKQVESLTEQIGFLVNLHVKDRERQPRDDFFRQAGTEISERENADELARIYRHYLLWSTSGDVATVFGPLTRMNPAHLDFNPESFQYGGLLLYPIAGMIKVFSMLGGLELNPRLTYYVRHPEEFLRMALVGRFYIALMNIVCACLIWKMGTLWKGPWVGLWAGLFYALTPAVVLASHEMKPHVLANVFTVASFGWALLYTRGGRDRTLFASAAFSGLAMGSALNAGVSLLFPAVALLLRRRWDVRRLAVVALIHFGVHALVNPYFWFNLSIVRIEARSVREVYWLHWRDQPGGVLTALHQMLYEGMTVVGAAVFLVSFIGGFFQRDPQSRRELALIVLPPLAYAGLFAMATRGMCPVRYAVFLYPFTSLVMANGVVRLMSQRGWRGIAVGSLCAIALAVDSASYLLRFHNEALGRDALARAGGWLGKLPPNTKIGSFQQIKPGGFSALPFRRYRMIIVDEKFLADPTRSRVWPDFVLSLSPRNLPPSWECVARFRDPSLFPQSDGGMDVSIYRRPSSSPVEGGAP